MGSKGWRLSSVNRPADYFFHSYKSSKASTDDCICFILSTSIWREYFCYKLLIKFEMETPLYYTGLILTSLWICFFFSSLCPLSLGRTGTELGASCYPAWWRCDEPWWSRRGRVLLLLLLLLPLLTRTVTSKDIIPFTAWYSRNTGWLMRLVVNNVSRLASPFHSMTTTTTTTITTSHPLLGSNHCHRCKGTHSGHQNIGGGEIQSTRLKKWWR